MSDAHALPAGELGHRVVRLDTHRTLTEAIRMYEQAGYRAVARYNDNPYAQAWFEKRLTAATEFGETGARLPRITARKESAMPAGKKPGPSVKDDKLYEKLRDEGNSKEKSARIANAAANTSRSAVGKKGGKSGSYDDWTVSDLRKRAAELDIGGRSSMSKSDLVKALRDH